MKRINQALVACGVAALLAGSASGNILLNPGFELGSGADAADWLELTGASGSVERSTVSPHSGDYHMYLSFDHFLNPPAGAAYFIEQNQGANTIDNADNFNVSFYAKTDTMDFTGLNMFFQVLWLDQDGSDGGGVKGESLTYLIPLGINTTYQQFGLSDMDAPDGSDSFLLRIQLSAGAVADIAQGLYVDDVVFEKVIPEPGTFGLLGMGVLAMFTRRRGA